MAKQVGSTYREMKQKKSSQGMGKRTKYGNKGGGPNGSTKSKNYKKKSRGQGKKR